MVILNTYLKKTLFFLKKLLHKPTRDDVLIPIVARLLNIKILGRTEFLQPDPCRQIWQFGSEEAIATTNPHHQGALPPAIAPVLGHLDICQSFVAEVEQAQLISALAVGFTRGGDLIAETTLPPTTLLKPRIEGGIPLESLLWSRWPSKTIHLETVCSLINYWSQNYYHWLIDGLARLELVDYYQENTGRKPQVLIGPQPQPWQLDALQLLGYESRDLILWNAHRARVDRLIIPSFRRQGERVSPHAVQWLRQRILSRLSQLDRPSLNYSSKIYVSRAQASGRRVINEDEVLQVLEPLGFVSYRLEELSFAEQVSLFSGAEMVIAPHGAGLTNIIFAPAGASVIEFVTPQVSPGFFILSAVSDLRHGCLLCPQPQLEKLRRTRGDLMVDTTQLKDLIHDMEPALTA